MSAGRNVGDAVWRASARNVLASAAGLVSLEADWDVEKCYEHVSHTILADMAVRLNFPLVMIRVAINSYRAPRRLLWDAGLCTDALFPTRGIVAGSSGATFELVC